ncbi:MAG: cytochrome C oxidase subunit IV family protein [Phycisphaerales bacterium]|nr:cytochrome C oxidase subunit IV family protein [Phycisphaerales bacterium]
MAHAHDHKPKLDLDDGRFDPHETLASDEAHAGHHVHVASFGLMFWVFAILLVLTALTVWTSRLPMSHTAHLVMAIVIATVKALLVAAFFMHLWWDKALNTIVVSATLFAAVLFVGLTLLDVNSRALVTPMEKPERIAGGVQPTNAELTTSGAFELSRRAAEEKKAKGLPIDHDTGHGGDKPH